MEEETMNKYLIVFVLLLLPFVAAQEVGVAESRIVPPDFGGTLVGQNHYYYVVFDGEGEASVIGRIEIQNTDELQNLEITVPGKDIRLISIVQEYYDYKEECLVWEDVSCTSENGSETCVRDCQEYYSYPVYPPHYAEVTYEDVTSGAHVGQELSLNLTIPKSEQEQLVLLVYYKTPAYVTKSGGVFSYDFSTITNGFDVNFVRVSLDVAEDLYMEGVESEIEYRESVLAAKADVAAVASSLAYIDTGYTQTASSLDPFETFHVTGRYATSWFILNWPNVVGGVLLGLLVLGLIGWGIRTLYQRDKKLGISLGVGVASGVLLWMIWFGSLFLLEKLYYFVGYPYSGPFGLLVIILAILASLLLLIVPGVFVGIRKGMSYGLYCLIATVATLFVLTLVTLIVWALFFRMVQGPPIYY